MRTREAAGVHVAMAMSAEPDVHCMADADGDGSRRPVVRTDRSLTQTQTPCGAPPAGSLTRLIESRRVAACLF
jgi:hypothetical protein